MVEPGGRAVRLVYTIYTDRVFTCSRSGETEGSNVGGVGGYACVSSIYFPIAWSLKRRHRIRHKFCYNIIMLSEYKTSSFLCVSVVSSL